MTRSFNPKDHYFYLAKKQGLVARSFFKLEEIDHKYHIFDKSTKSVLDIGCAPGSRIQYADQQCSKYHKSYHIMGFDLLPSKVYGDHIHLYQHDVTDSDFVHAEIIKHCPDGLDCIISDMAPNTTGFKQIDAMRSLDLIKQTLYIYQQHLKSNGKCVIKCFMGPGFDQFVRDFKQAIPGSCKIFKPQASRSPSKEVYLVKFQ